jgi:hypothetical protein
MRRLCIVRRRGLTSPPWPSHRSDCRVCKKGHRPLHLLHALSSLVSTQCCCLLCVLRRLSTKLEECARTHAAGGAATTGASICGSSSAGGSASCIVTTAAVEVCGGKRVGAYSACDASRGPEGCKCTQAGCQVRGKSQRPSVPVWKQPFPLRTVKEVACAARVDFLGLCIRKGIHSCMNSPRSPSRCQWLRAPGDAPTWKQHKA